MNRPNEQRATGYGTLPSKGAVDLASVRLRNVKSEPVIGDVEVNVPIPPKPGKQASDIAKSVQSLKVGQSRLYRNVEAKRLYGHCKVAREKVSGAEYTVRMMDDGVRVWRVK